VRRRGATLLRPRVGRTALLRRRMLCRQRVHGRGRLMRDGRDPRHVRGRIVWGLWRRRAAVLSVHGHRAVHGRRRGMPRRCVRRVRRRVRAVLLRGQVPRCVAVVRGDDVRAVWGPDRDLLYVLSRARQRLRRRRMLLRRDLRRRRAGSLWVPGRRVHLVRGGRPAVLRRQRVRRLRMPDGTVRLRRRLIGSPFRRPPGARHPAAEVEIGPSAREVGIASPRSTGVRHVGPRRSEEFVVLAGDATGGV
jgi:hypothetical protein